MRETMRTEEVAVTLVLSIEELRTLLADNTDLVSGLFATLSERDPGSRAPVQPTSAGAELAQLAAGGLTPIEKVLALQKMPLFSRTSVEEMQQVAAVTTTVTMTAGAPLFPEVGAAGAMDDPLGRGVLAELRFSRADPRARGRHHRRAADC